MFVCATQIVKMWPEFFHQSYKQKPFKKMCLNFTANSFVFGHINRKYAPKTSSVNLASKNFENVSIVIVSA